MNYEKISRQVVFSYLGNAIIFLVGPLLIFLLTRSLSMDEYGVYSLFSSTRMVTTIILELGLVQYILTKLSSYEKKDQIKSFFSFMIFESFFLVTIIVGIGAIALNTGFLSWFKLQDYVLHFNLLLMIIFVSVFIRMIVGYLSAKKELEFVSLVNVMRNCLWVFILLILFYVSSGLNLYHVLLVWFCGLLVTLLMQFFYLRNDVVEGIKHASFSKAIVKKGLFFSLPLIPAILGSWIVSIGDRYMIAYFMSTADVGLYTLAYSLLSIIVSIGAVTITIMYPYIADAWNNNQNHQILFNITIKYILLVIIPALVGLAVLREQIVTLVAGTEYIKAASLILPLLFYPLFVILIELLYKNLLLREKTRVIGKIYILGALLNLILNWFLIPYIGLLGAAYATIITYTLMFLFMLGYSGQHFEWDHKYISIDRILIASVLMSVVVYFMNPAEVVSKILTVFFGAIFYFSLLFVFGAFKSKEIALLKQFISKSVDYIKKLY